MSAELIVGIALVVVIVVVAAIWAWWGSIESGWPSASIPRASTPTPSPTSSTSSPIWWTVGVVGVIGLLVVINKIFPGALASSPTGPISAASKPKGDLLGPVVNEIRASIEEAGNFFETPSTWAVPIPELLPGSKETPVRYVHVPPATNLRISWPNSGWQYSWGNELEVNGQMVNAHLYYSPSASAATMAVRGHYARPQYITATPTVDVTRRPDPEKMVLATTVGTKSTTGEWKPAWVKPGPQTAVWGKVPEDRSISWECSVTIAGAAGKPALTGRPPVQLCRHIGKHIAEEDRYPLVWEKHFPPLDPKNPKGPKDKSVMRFTNKDVPAGFNNVVIVTNAKEAQWIYVDFVLRP